MFKGYFTHEKLARLFVTAIYVTGTLLTLLAAVEALYRGFLSSFGRLRMFGLLLSFVSLGLLLSRLVAGRWGNRLAARLLPCRLDRAVSARRIMADLGLSSVEELCALIRLYHLSAYSAIKPLDKDFVRNLDCLLEPLFLHKMYLPMTRTWLVKSGRLIFDAEKLAQSLNSEKARLTELPDLLSSFDSPASENDEKILSAEAEISSPVTGTEDSVSDSTSSSHDSAPHSPAHKNAD